MSNKLNSVNHLGYLPLDRAFTDICTDALPDFENYFVVVWKHSREKKRIFTLALVHEGWMVPMFWNFGGFTQNAIRIALIILNNWEDIIDMEAMESALYEARDLHHAGYVSPENVKLLVALDRKTWESSEQERLFSDEDDYDDVNCYKVDTHLSDLLEMFN